MHTGKLALSHKQSRAPSHTATPSPAAWLGSCWEARNAFRPDDIAAKLCRIVMLRSFRRSREPFSVRSVLQFQDDELRSVTMQTKQIDASHCVR